MRGLTIAPIVAPVVVVLLLALALTDGWMGVMVALTLGLFGGTGWAMLWQES